MLQINFAGGVFSKPCLLPFLVLIGGGGGGGKERDGVNY